MALDYDDSKTMSSINNNVHDIEAVLCSINETLGELGGIIASLSHALEERLYEIEKAINKK